MLLKVGQDMVALCSSMNYLDRHHSHASNVLLEKYSYLTGSSRRYALFQHSIDLTAFPGKRDLVCEIMGALILISGECPKNRRVQGKLTGSKEPFCICMSTHFQASGNFETLSKTLSKYYWICRLE